MNYFDSNQNNQFEGKAVQKYTSTSHKKIH